MLLSLAPTTVSDLRIVVTPYDRPPHREGTPRSGTPDPRASAERSDRHKLLIGKNVDELEARGYLERRPGTGLEPVREEALATGARSAEVVTVEPSVDDLLPRRSGRDEYRRAGRHAAPGAAGLVGSDVGQLARTAWTSGVISVASPMRSGPPVWETLPFTRRRTARRARRL
ncbi:hypothetical protein GCM10009610_06320 [Pseudonocardia xinjiangensis]